MNVFAARWTGKVMMHRMIQNKVMVDLRYTPRLMSWITRRVNMPCSGMNRVVMLLLSDNI